MSGASGRKTQRLSLGHHRELESSGGSFSFMFGTCTGMNGSSSHLQGLHVVFPRGLWFLTECWFPGSHEVQAPSMSVMVKKALPFIILPQNHVASLPLYSINQSNHKLTQSPREGMKLLHLSGGSVKEFASIF